MAPRSSGISDDHWGMAAPIDDTQIEAYWPRSIGFFGAFGAVGAAVALDLLSMPIAMFVAAVPVLKIMNRRRDSARAA